MKNNKTSGIVAYLAIAFGLAWLNWIVLWLMGLSPAEEPQAFQLLALPASFAPAIGTLIVRRWVTREGFGDAGLGLKLRRKWPYYLVAWLLPLAIIACVVVLAPALGISRPDFSLARAYQSMGQAPGGPPLAARMPMYLLIALIMTPVLWGEEFGWRGYLQIRLLADRPLLAAVATGLIWGVWHYPLILMGFEYPDQRLMGLLVFPVTTVLYAIILGWLFQRSGSIWPASLFHAAMNTIAGNVLLLLFRGGPNFIFVSHEGLLIWIPMALLSAWIVLSGRLHIQTRRLLRDEGS
jgi:membrane protease YdiL (CAAX protease family)